jgi:predicted transcriptional regulator
MKKTNSTENLKKAKRFYELTQQLRELNKEQEELKEYFKSLVGDDGGLVAGDITISVDERTRTNFDAKALTEDKGVEFVAKYQNMTVFKVVSVAKGK